MATHAPPTRPPPAWRRMTGVLAAPATPTERRLLFALFLALTLLRMPQIVLHGRFWAEEGRVFYPYAARHAWFATLTYAYAGYLNLGVDLAALAARLLVPLDQAPRVTFAFALAAQACPALLLTGSTAGWLRPRATLAAALWLLVAAPSAEEVWLNTLHSQFQLALGAALIVALPVERGGRALFRGVVVVLAPLYGLPAGLLLPLFVLRAATQRHRARTNEALLLALSTALQVGAFYHRVGGRQSLDPPLIAGTLLAKLVLLPFLGFAGAQPLSSALHAALRRDLLPGAAVLAIVAALGVAIALARRAPAEARVLWLGCALLGVGSYYGALFASPDQVEPHLGGRYAFAPQVLMAWGLLRIAGGGGRRGWIAGVLAGWLCVADLGAYADPAVGFARGPNWQSEMEKWHRDPRYSPLIWPQGAWWVPMPLPPRPPLW